MQPHGTSPCGSGCCCYSHVDLQKKSPKLGVQRIVVGVGPWQSWSVSWRELLLCQCFPGGPQGLESTWGRACFDLPSICASEWLERPLEVFLLSGSRQFCCLFGLWGKRVSCGSPCCTPAFLGYDSVSTGGSTPTFPTQFLQCGKEKPVQASSLFFSSLFPLPTALSIVCDSPLNSLTSGRDGAALLPSPSNPTRHQSVFWRCLCITLEMSNPLHT